LLYLFVNFYRIQPFQKKYNNLFISGSISDIQIVVFLKWLNSIKVDKQIQQTSAILEKKENQRIITISFICAMTSTVVLATLFSTLNIKHLGVDFSFDVSTTPPSLSIDASVCVANGCFGLIKEPDFQPLIPLIKLFENARIDVKFASLNDFLQSGKFESVMKLIGFLPKDYHMINQFLTSHDHSEIIASQITHLLKAILSIDASLIEGSEHLHLVKSISKLLVFNTDNVLDLSFKY